MTDWISSAEPSDPPEHDPFTPVMQAIYLVATKLRDDPALSKTEARLSVKLVLPECSIYFQSLIWPEARKLAGLPALPRGRPSKKHVFIAPGDSLE